MIDDIDQDIYSSNLKDTNNYIWPCKFHNFTLESKIIN